MARAVVGRDIGRHRVTTVHTPFSVRSMLVDLIWLVFGVILVVLALRFALLLFGANPAAPFTQLIYGISAPFMMPFEAVFGATAVEGSIFDWSVLLAMVVYTLIAWMLTSLILAIVPAPDAQQVSTEEASTVAEDQIASDTAERDVYVERRDERVVEPPSGYHRDTPSTR